MEVKLEYFKATGKWYGEGSYRSQHEESWDIHDEVRDKAYHLRNLPGLTEGHDNYYVLVSLPEHQYNVPRLLLP